MESAKNPTSQQAQVTSRLSNVARKYATRKDVMKVGGAQEDKFNEVRNSMMIWRGEDGHEFGFADGASGENCGATGEGMAQAPDWRYNGETSLRVGEYGGLEISPLAVVAPEQHCEDIAPEEVLEKVLSQISEVSRCLGVSFEGFEKEAMKLFSDIEAVWTSRMPARGKKKNKLDRELQKLECSVNYGGNKGEIGQSKLIAD